MDNDPRRLVAALRASHDALLSLVSQIPAEQLDLESYCKGWDVGQVLSHLGSGAEIGLTNLERALAGEPTLGRDDFPLIWGQWNALTPPDKARQLVVWDRRHVSVLQALDDETVRTLRIPSFGMGLDVATFAGFRLNEHAVHSWDVAVVLGPGAELLPAAVEMMVDRMGFLVERAAKVDEAGGAKRVEIRTSHPERRFVLSLEDKARLSGEAGAAVDGTLELPAAAFVRLVLGRLDPAHTPPQVRVDGKLELEDLRRVFPGF